jgi:hypothetical protein
MLAVFRIVEFSSINLAAANQAIEWCIYLESHANRLYSSAESSQLDSARALINKIKTGEIQNGCSLRDIYYAKHWARLGNRKEVEDAGQYFGRSWLATCQEDC